MFSLHVRLLAALCVVLLTQSCGPVKCGGLLQKPDRIYAARVLEVLSEEALGQADLYVKPANAAPRLLPVDIVLMECRVHLSWGQGGTKHDYPDQLPYWLYSLRSREPDVEWRWHFIGARSGRQHFIFTDAERTESYFGVVIHGAVVYFATVGEANTPDDALADGLLAQYENRAGLAMVIEIVGEEPFLTRDAIVATEIVVLGLRRTEDGDFLLQVSGHPTRAVQQPVQPITLRGTGVQWRLVKQ